MRNRLPHGLGRSGHWRNVTGKVGRGQSESVTSRIPMLHCADPSRGCGVSASPDVRAVAVRDFIVSDSLRHPAIIRATHWITTISFFALLVSGIAILLAHPRLYWGETGGVGAPSLIDLPLPFVLDVPIRGPGRYLHFLSAWVFVITGLIYVITGTFTQHFRRHLLPDKSQFGWEAVKQVVSNHLRLKPPIEEAVSYNLLQRVTYLVVLFVLAPLMICTGLAMSPGITSVFPAVVKTLGGQQSARTLHFFLAIFLVLFLVVHIAMVCLAGFKKRVGAMITGRTASERDCP
jgi:thiosulfate reductase cytochrome b subunit